MSRRLTKSRRNVVFTGTLGGIAEYLGIDPTIVRFVYVILSVFTVAFPGLFLYILLVFIIPADRGNNYESRNYRENPYQRQGGFYQSNYRDPKQTKRKEAEKINDDDWSDF